MIEIIKGNPPKYHCRSSYFWRNFNEITFSCFYRALWKLSAMLFHDVTNEMPLLTCTPLYCFLEGLRSNKRGVVGSKWEQMKQKNKWGCFHSDVGGMEDIIGLKIKYVAPDIKLHQMYIFSDNLTFTLPLSDENVPATYCVRII